MLLCWPRNTSPLIRKGGKSNAEVFRSPQMDVIGIGWGASGVRYLPLICLTLGVDCTEVIL